MLKSRNVDVTEGMVRSATQGMKEAESSQMTVLNDLFAPLSRKRAKELGIREDEARFVTRLSREIDGCGSIDKVAIGASSLMLVERLTTDADNQAVSSTMPCCIGTTEHLLDMLKAQSGCARTT